MEEEEEEEEEGHTEMATDSSLDLIYAFAKVNLRTYPTANLRS